MAGREDEAQQLVAQIVVQTRVQHGFDRVRHVASLAVQLTRDLLMLARPHPVAPDGVDGAAPGGGHQPRAGIGRHAGPGPLGERDDQRVLRQFLGPVDVAQ